MSDEFLAVNGLDGATGEYLYSNLTARELAAFAKGEALEKGHLRELERKVTSEDHMGPIEGVDALDIGESGWAVIFPFFKDERRTDELRAALAPLLELRQSQTEWYRELVGPDAYRPEESKRDFLRRFGVGAGPPDPEKMPYYLLLVGSPAEIPYKFQYQLDVQYAVGRIHFDDLDDYAAYAHTVVSAEKGELRRARRAAFFGVDNPNDKATNLSTKYLVGPLADVVAENNPTWEVPRYLTDEATKARLDSLLAGDGEAALLFTASHGLGFPIDHPLLRDHGGALVCQDWQGPGNPVLPETYFSADDLSQAHRPGGMITFHFACFGAGTPLHDEFPDQERRASRRGRQLTPEAFIARLPQRLLAHPRGGALATIGHVEKAWPCSFHWRNARSQIGAFQSTLDQLLANHPVGHAMERFNQRYAELATELAATLEEAKFGREIDDFDLAEQWTNHSDARNYIIVGDPAVRLNLATGDEGQNPRPVIELRSQPRRSGGDQQTHFGVETAKDLESSSTEDATADGGFVISTWLTADPADPADATLAARTVIRPSGDVDTYLAPGTAVAEIHTESVKAAVRAWQKRQDEP